MPPGPIAARTRRFRVPLLAFVCAFALHAASLDHELLNWDDPDTIVRQPAVTAGDWGAIWRGETPQVYPLTFSLFAIEWRLWGEAPVGYHAVSVVLHAVNAALAAAVAGSLGLGPVAALVAALVFALHPVQVATVAWVSEQKTLLAALFSLACWRVLLSAPLSGRRTLVATSIHVAALLAKTQVLLWPLGALFISGVGTGGAERRRWLGAVAAVLALGLAAAAVTMRAERTPHLEGGLALDERIWVRGRSFLFAARTTLFPSELSALYPRWTVDTSSPMAWLPTAAGCALLALFIALAFRREKARAAVGAFVLPWLPVSGLISFGYQEKSFVADHFLYLSLFGAGLAVGAMLDGARRRRGAWVTSGIGLAVVACALLTLARLPVYRDSIAFWESVLERNPTAWVGENNLGVAYLERGEIAAARAHLESALRIRPGYYEARLNLADVRLRQGDRDGAAHELREALRAKPGDATALERLAFLGDSTAVVSESAMAAAVEALDRTARSAASLLELGRLQIGAGDPGLAIASFQAALAHASTAAESARAYTAIGFTRTAEHRLADATEAYEAALALTPEDPIAHMNVGVLLRSQGRFRDAIVRLEEAQRLAPDDAKISANLEKARRRVR